MFRRLLPLLPVLAAGHAADASGEPARGGRPFPPVERMYPSQRWAMQELTEAARSASPQATANLLALLDSPAFRSQLRACCEESGIAAAPARELLRILHENLASAELVHNFENGHSVLDLEVLLRNASGYVPTSWQMIFLGYYGNETERYGHPASCADAAEEGLYRFPPFSGEHDLPGSWEEASGRSQYVALNMLRVDTGNPEWGNVSLVFSPAFWRDAVAACPLDTGLYTFSCNETYIKTPGAFLPPSWSAALKCDHDPTPGVLGAMDHALLNNGLFYPGNLERLFARWYGRNESFTNVSLEVISRYIETNIFANVPLAPRGVKLMVAAFVPLFGTAKGRLLQRLAARHGIAVAWAFGEGVLSVPESAKPHLDSFQPRPRILDPTSIGLLNVSAGNVTGFQQLWEDVAAARDPSGGLPGGFQLWSRAEGELASLRMAVPEPGACGDWARCVGRLLQAGCACYQEEEIFAFV